MLGLTIGVALGLTIGVALGLTIGVGEGEAPVFTFKQLFEPRGGVNLY